MSELLGYENYHSNGPGVISGATPQGQTPILLRRLCIAAFCSQSASRCDLNLNGSFTMKVVLIVYIYISQGCHFLLGVSDSLRHTTRICSGKSILGVRMQEHSRTASPTALGRPCAMTIPYLRIPPRSPQQASNDNGLSSTFSRLLENKEFAHLASYELRNKVRFSPTKSWTTPKGGVN